MALSAQAPSKAPRKRIYHELDTPFTTVAWPTVTPEDEDVILELLCSLLSPLGQHRKRHVQSSKGKWARRKERKAKAKDDCLAAAEANLTPPVPEVSKYLDVGLAAVTRHLQEIAQSTSQSGEGSADRPGPYDAVFIARAGQSLAFNSHVPQMISVAAKSRPESPATRLVGFLTPCAERLAACLGIPRVSCIGLKAGAPGAGALVDFVQAHVSEVDAAWLGEAKDGAFKATRINAVETTVGAKRTKKTPPS